MPSRRGSAQWGSRAATDSPAVDVLIPTAGRVAELAVTLAGLAAQDDPPFRVIVSDQSDVPAEEAPAVQAMIRVLDAQGRPTRIIRHLPRRGLAEQRQFLLSHSGAPSVLFLDDDVWLEPGALATLHEALVGCETGLVGMAVQGLSFLDDERPAEREAFQPWQAGIQPERVDRDTEAFDRWPLHNAANLVHLAREVELPAQGWLPYKVAWIGGCVMYRRAALIAVGGFDFWQEVPADHSGEDVLAQWRVMERYGGAGIIPSGAVHLEAPTTIPRRPVEAFDLVRR
jgi:GT2 family glycosyltransferase